MPGRNRSRDDKEEEEDQIQTRPSKVLVGAHLGVSASLERALVLEVWLPLLQWTGMQEGGQVAG